MKIRFAADFADSTDSCGFYLFLSALIRPICVLSGESTLLSFACFSFAALREISFLDPARLGYGVLPGF